MDRTERTVSPPDRGVDSDIMKDKGDTNQPELGTSETPPARASLRALPSVDRLLNSTAATELRDIASRQAVAAVLRQAVQEARVTLLTGCGAAPAGDAIVTRAAEILAAQMTPWLRPVLNATGIVLHTNLGRAPLAPEAVAATGAVAAGYANLEFDLDSGRRGSRYANLERLLCDLTGAEAALVVNNNAAAVLLALSALAAGGDVVVSRGELVEIGGGFRVPEVISQGGARLVEVGTTNKTRLADYRAAIGPATRLLLRVHPSNYRISGFTSAPSLPDLAELAHEQGLLLVEDLGSGTLLDLRRWGLPHEPTVRESVAAGVDLVTFSGDKLLGGPQAGLLVGRAAALAPLRKHPLLRAVRIDKLSLAALEATLRLYQDPERAAERVPVLRMLATPASVLQARAARLQALLGPCATMEPTDGFAGGGALPAAPLPSWVVAVTLPGVSAMEVARRLRQQRPAVVGRIAGDQLLLDVLTLPDDALEAVALAVGAASA